MSDQDMVYDALRPHLDLLEGPCPYRPQWWQFGARKRDDYIQHVLRDAGLPPLTDEGRIRYYPSGPQGFEDAGGAWSRKWCAALGLSYLDAFDDKIHPRLSEPRP